MRKYALILALLVFGFTGCREKMADKPSEGYITVHGKKLWYKVYGSGEATPLLMLHGGPGFPSYYLEPLAKRLGSERKVIVFDQVGSGRSERITDTSLMTIQFHVDQVDSLVQYFGLKNYYLYGHSWGTMLAMEYYLQHPEGIAAIVLASPCMRTKTWEEDAAILAGLLPDTTRDILRKYIHHEPVDSAKFSAAADTYFATYYNRKQPKAPEVDSSLRNTGEALYTYMWGKFDFECNGTLKHFDRTPDLPKLKLPVLFTCGEFDAARPGTVKRYQHLVPGAKLVVIPGAGHGTMGDNPDADYNAVSSFLQAQDKKK